MPWLPLPGRPPSSENSTVALPAAHLEWDSAVGAAARQAARYIRQGDTQAAAHDLRLGGSRVARRQARACSRI